MSDNKTFLYAELQIAVPFADAGWQKVNDIMKQVPGLRAKTWLSGVGTHSVGGFYEFDTVENARNYAEGALADIAKSLGVGLTIKMFDGAVVAEASRLMHSPHFA